MCVILRVIPFARTDTRTILVCPVLGVFCDDNNNNNNNNNDANTRTHHEPLLRRDAVSSANSVPCTRIPPRLCDVLRRTRRRRGERSASIRSASARAIVFIFFFFVQCYNRQFIILFLVSVSENLAIRSPKAATK